MKESDCLRVGGSDLHTHTRTHTHFSTSSPQIARNDPKFIDGRSSTSSILLLILDEKEFFDNTCKNVTHTAGTERVR